MTTCEKEDCDSPVYKDTPLCYDHLLLSVVDALPKWAQRRYELGKLDVQPGIERAIKLASAPGKAAKRVREKMLRLSRRFGR